MGISEEETGIEEIQRSAGNWSLCWADKWKQVVAMMWVYMTSNVYEARRR